MKFKLWLENTQSIPIKDIVMSQSELMSAIENIVRGYSSQTEGPLEVAYLPKYNKYHLTNGYHRIIEYLMNGKTHVPITVSYEADWSLQKDIFEYQPELPYKGLEDFVEPYMLRKL